MIPPMTRHYAFNRVFIPFIFFVMGVVFVLGYQTGRPPLCEDVPDNPCCREAGFIDDMLSSKPIDPSRR